MARATSPSFVAELPLVVQSTAEPVLLARFEAARRLYNAVLGEALRRLAQMRESKAWQAARAMPKGKARNTAFKACNERFGFSEYALHAVATAHKNAAGFSNRLGAHETQKIATRVWKAVSEYAFGARGKLRFKGAHRPLHALEGKSNTTGIRWNRETGCLTWGGQVLPAKLPSERQDPYLHEALAAKTKYCRVVWRIESGRRRWFAQLVQEGSAPAKYRFHADGQVVGLDVGPSAIAIVGDEAVGLERFAPSVVHPWKAARRLQRALDRSRRATNPANYAANGTVKAGRKTWHKSKRYKVIQARLAETERKLAATRKKEHGELANRILGLGTVIQTETLSYRAFQKKFGRSVKVRAPGAFMALLSRKAESAGGKLETLNTGTLRMSQYDHVTGECTRKPLSQRWHRLGGSRRLVQRDIYSAFLAKHATEGQHNPLRLEHGWTVAEPLLARAGLCCEESASGMPTGSPTVPIPSERIAREKRFVRGHVREGVRRKAENPETPPMHAFRTPCLSGMGRLSVRLRAVEPSSAVKNT